MQDVQDNEEEYLPYSALMRNILKRCHSDPILHIMHIFFILFFLHDESMVRSWVSLKKDLCNTPEKLSLSSLSTLYFPPSTFP